MLDARVLTARFPQGFCPVPPHCMRQSRKQEALRLGPYLSQLSSGGLYKVKELMVTSSAEM